MPGLETGTPTAASTPATPDTPGGPLFSSVRVDSLDQRESFGMGRCNNCFPGKSNGGCINIADFSASVSLTQKVTSLFLCVCLFWSTMFGAIFFVFFFCSHVTAHKLIQFDI